MTSDQSGSRNNSNWVLDSGASHHMTSDLQNLSIHSEYRGPEDIMVGDGKTIPITHTGSTSLHTPIKSFPLPHVLCSPHISHNLISVSKFCTHNNTSIEFFPNYFLQILILLSLVILSSTSIHIQLCIKHYQKVTLFGF